MLGFREAPSKAGVTRLLKAWSEGDDLALEQLTPVAEMPKLFVEYVGMGDSDKPKDYAYSTAERADLAEVRELYNALGRHDGLAFLAAAAGFVADHKAQGERLDFGRLFQAHRDQFPFLVGGSDQDPFERGQIDLAQERLGKFGLQIERLPDGHLTTNEQPGALARLIAKVRPRTFESMVSG